MRKRKFTLRRAISRLRGSNKSGEVLSSVIASGSSSEIEAVSQCNCNSIPAGKKKAGARLWMKLDRNGQCEVAEWGKTTIIKRAAIPARDLRMPGPLFSHSCSIVAREKAMVLNLDFIKAIVTAEELFLLDPLRQEVLPFVDQLQQLALKSNWIWKSHTSDGTDVQDSPTEVELPFEFQVLEIALQVVCLRLGSSVADLEKDAYPRLDELARNVSTKNLEHVRSLKSKVTRLLSRVQKVRDELEHLLDNNDDMAELYLTRKSTQNLQESADVLATPASNALVRVQRQLSRLSSIRSGTAMNMTYMPDVEDLEMLLEAYFMHLDGFRNKILSVREYIDDTEDYVNIQLDHHRNELIQLQLTLVIASLAISLETIVAATFGMNMRCSLYDMNGVFEYVVGGTTLVCALIFMLILGYARWKKLLGS